MWQDRSVLGKSAAGAAVNLFFIEDIFHQKIRACDCGMRNLRGVYIATIETPVASPLPLPGRKSGRGVMGFLF